MNEWENIDLSSMPTSAEFYGIDLGPEKPLSNAFIVVENPSVPQDGLTQNEYSLDSKSRTLKLKRDKFTTMTVSGNVTRIDCKNPGSLVRSH